MSSFAVTLEEIEVLPHPNADALELAKVGGYHAVIPKGKYSNGETVVYIPEQAILPDDLISFMGLEGKLSGRDKNRVKPIRLRGELSQGLVMQLEDADEYLGNALESAFAGSDMEDWGDLSELFGITKWVPPIPTEMSGQVEHKNCIVKWPDVENIKRFPDMFTERDVVSVTEKIHGTCFGMTWDEQQGFAVYSKGLGAQGLALVESDTNIYWRAVHKYNLTEILQEFAQTNKLDRVAIFGEVYGAGVQDLGYGVNAKTDGPGFVAFDLWVRNRNDAEGAFLLPHSFGDICAHYYVPTVPNLGSMLYDYDKISEMASGKTLVGGDNIREGVVVRPCAADLDGSRRIAKFVSEEYLTRKNGTEYE